MKADSVLSVYPFGEGSTQLARLFNCCSEPTSSILQASVGDDNERTILVCQRRSLFLDLFFQECLFIHDYRW